MVVLALAFDFTNGIHDAANSIATVVSTRVLSPLQAVVWAAFFNFVAAYVFGTHVARTVGTGVVQPQLVDTLMIFRRLLGAILWNLLTWYLGLPTSSSHALIGALAGAAVAKAGTGAVILSGLLKIAAFIILSPLIGLVLGFVVGVAMTWIFHKATPRRVDFLFRKGQLLSAALYSLGHGTNDAQKTMGIIALLLYTSVRKGRDFEIEPWIKLDLLHGHGRGNPHRRMADRQDHGIEDPPNWIPLAASARIRCGRHAVCHGGRGHSRQHHPHHRRIDRRFRGHAAPCHSLGGNGRHHVGVAFDHSCCRLYRRPDLSRRVGLAGRVVADRRGTSAA